MIVVDEETKVSKPHMKINPTGKYPLLEVEEGTLAGAPAITKYMCRLANKMFGSSNAEKA